MRKTIVALTMAASVLALSACSGGASGDKLVSSKAGDITKDELYDNMKDSVGAQALQLMVIEKVLEDKYDVTDKQVQAELDKTKEQLGDSFEQTLAQQGQTEESLTDVIRLNLLQEAALTDGVEITDEEFEAHMKELEADQSNIEVNARHVLLEDEKTALEVKEKLEGGADFAEIAKEFSTEEAAQESGGDLGWFGKGSMVPEFEEAVFTMELNKISEPVKTEHGFHIIEVLEKRDIMDDEEIRKELLIEKADPNTIVEKIAKLMKDADVKLEIKDEELQSALDMFLKADAEDEKVDEDVDAEKEEK